MRSDKRAKIQKKTCIKNWFEAKVNICNDIFEKKVVHSDQKCNDNFERNQSFPFFSRTVRLEMSQQDVKHTQTGRITMIPTSECFSLCSFQSQRDFHFTRTNLMLLRYWEIVTTSAFWVFDFSRELLRSQQWDKFPPSWPGGFLPLIWRRRILIYCGYEKLGVFFAVEYVDFNDTFVYKSWLFDVSKAPELCQFVVKFVIRS